MEHEAVTVISCQEARQKCIESRRTWVIAIVGMVMTMVATFGTVAVAQYTMAVRHDERIKVIENQEAAMQRELDELKENLRVIREEQAEIKSDLKLLLKAQTGNGTSR